MSSHLVIHTERLRSVAGTKQLANLAINDSAAFAAALDVQIPAEWPPELMRGEPEVFTATKLSEHPEQAGWWIWYIISKQQPRDVLIGTGGLKGPPVNGVVEVGYGLIDAYQGRGLATEVTQALIAWAFTHPDVQSVVAETLPDHAASIRVMEKCGMRFLGDGSEPGVIRYGLRRP